MNVGDTITVTLDKSKAEILLTLEDHVYPDRTCGQFDSGFWAFQPHLPKINFFVSIDGTVYGMNPQDGGACTLAIGRCDAMRLEAARREFRMEFGYDMPEDHPLLRGS